LLDARAMILTLAFAAQLLTAQLQPPILPAPEHAQALEHARVRKATGMTWMVTGLVHLGVAGILGAVWIGTSVECSRNPSCRNEDFVTPSAAGALLGAGVIASAIGVPIYVSGANRVARLRVEPRATGLALRF
jgi:hypothetical protein